ncbi:MAG TPA: hypothetical protein O0X09_00650 [Methanocorpusculum sp.]|nr:hypothetical protein [Methanocorpusculum sp.]
MKKTAVFAVLILCIAVVAAAGCIGPAEPIDYPTALVGDWKSVGTYDSTGGVKFHMIYHFNEDNTGTVVADVNGQAISSIDVFWGYVEKNGYIVGYTTTGNGDYLYISEDGKTLVNEFGETFKRV